MSAAWVALAMLATPSLASAQSSAETPSFDEKEVQPRHWYGWQTLSVDALPVALFFAAVPAEGQAEIDLISIGGLGFALGTPVLHLVHQRPGIAGASLAIRLGLPLAGSLIGAVGAACDLQPASSSPASSLDESEDCSRQVRSAYLGAMIGVFSASLLDASLFAFEPVRPPRRGIDASLASRTFAGVAPSAGGLRFALGAAF